MFRLLSVAAFFLVILSAAGAAGGGFVEWLEAERALSGSPPAQEGAVGRALASASGGQYVVVGAQMNDFVSYAFDLPADLADCRLSVRYSCSGYYTYFKLGRLLKVWRVSVDNQDERPLVLPPTHAQEHTGEPVWGMTSLSLGPMPRGRHVLTLRPMHDTWTHQISLDGLALHEGPVRFSGQLDANGRLAKPEPIAALPGGPAKAERQVLTVAEDDALVDLSGRGWRLHEDAGGDGESNHWHEAGFDDSGWKEVDLKSPWSNQGLGPYEGFAWYRRTVQVPAGWRGKDVRLYLARISQYGWLYVNGQLAHVSWEGNAGGACQVAGGAGGVGSKDISALLRFGEPNLLAIKVWGPSRGGIWEPPVLLYASERFEDRGGMFHLQKAEPRETYGILLGYHADALLRPSGYVTYVLSKDGSCSWPQTVLEQIPIPRHLLNRASPLCVAPRRAIEKAVASGLPRLDAERISPFAMHASRSGLRSIRVSPAAPAGEYLDVTLRPRSEFQRADTDTSVFDLRGVGPVDERSLPSHLHGKQRSHHGNPPQFQVDYSAAGEFSVFVERVGVDARLEITVDGKVAGAWDLPTKDQPTSEQDAQHKIWTCSPKRRFSVPIPAGGHVIGVSNTKDNVSWIRVGDYRLSRYAKDDFFGQGSAKVGRYQRLELEIDADAVYTNPYDPREVSIYAYFTTPSGRIERVSGFFNQDFELGKGASGQSLTPCKGPAWKVRYTPREVGDYTYVVSLDDGTGVFRSNPRRFASQPSVSKGFVRVSPKDPRYLAHDDGSPMFLLGVSGWLPQSLRAIEKQFQLQAENSQNFGFFPTFQWGELRTAPWVYSQMALWRMDRILADAEKHGIYLQVFHDEIRRGPFADKAFYRANGGPCTTPEMVYTNGTARAMSRNLVQQIVARYAHSPNILLWGFGDEVVQAQPTFRKWIREMVDEFRKADPYQHIAIVGEGAEWVPEGGDLIDLGGWYVHLNNPATKIGVDMPVFMEALIEPLRSVRKPVWNSEGGLCEVGPALGQSTEAFAGRSKDMIHLHNQIWSSLMLGYCGAGSEWLSGLVTKFTQHYHYKAVAAFLCGESLPESGFEPMKPPVSDPRLRAFSLHGPRKVFVWVQNRRHTWYKQIVEQAGLEEVRDATLRLGDLANGQWSVEWWDTYEGRVTEKATVSVRDGTAQLALPPISKDLAITLTRLSQ